MPALMGSGEALEEPTCWASGSDHCGRWIEVQWIELLHLRLVVQVVLS